MAIHIVCPQCGKSYDVPEQRAGQKGRCQCGGEIVVPPAGASPPPAQRPAAAGLAPQHPHPPSAHTPGPLGMEPSGTGTQPLGEAPAGIAYGTPPPQLSSRCPECGTLLSPGVRACPACAQRGAEIRAGAPVGRPVDVTILVILNYLLSLLFFIGGGLMVLATAMMGAALKAGAASGGAAPGFPKPPMGFPSGMPAAAGPALAGIGLGIAAGLIVAALVVLVLSIFLWKGANWARITMTVLCALNLLCQLAQAQVLKAMPMPVQAPPPVVGIILSVVVLVILNRPMTRRFCTQ